MKIYIVTVDDAEATMIISLHRTMEGALDSWNKERLELIEEHKRMIKLNKEDGFESFNSIYEEMICNLENTNYETICAWPQDTPHITEYEVVE